MVPLSSDSAFLSVLQPPAGGPDEYATLQPPLPTRKLSDEILFLPWTLLAPGDSFLFRVMGQGSISFPQKSPALHPVIPNLYAVYL